MTVNIEQLPPEVRDDVENQSLRILQQIQQHIVVIGGWAVRSYIPQDMIKYARYTLDIDAVATQQNIKAVHDVLTGQGFDFSDEEDWGIRFYKTYHPTLGVSCDPAFLKNLQIRIEISQPRINEIDTHHYFEFDLHKTNKKTITSHGKHQFVQAIVPEIECLALSS